MSDSVMMVPSTISRANSSGDQTAWLRSVLGIIPDGRLVGESYLITSCLCPMHLPQNTVSSSSIDTCGGVSMNCPAIPTKTCTAYTP